MWRHSSSVAPPRCPPPPPAQPAPPLSQQHRPRRVRRRAGRGRLDRRQRRRQARGRRGDGEHADLVHRRQVRGGPAAPLSLSLSVSLSLSLCLSVSLSVSLPLFVCTSRCSCRAPPRAGARPAPHRSPRRTVHIASRARASSSSPPPPPISRSPGRLPPVSSGEVEQHDVDGRPRSLLVHRKGATRAFPPHHPLVPVDYQFCGQPVLVGGSMGRS